MTENQGNNSPLIPLKRRSMLSVHNNCHENAKKTIIYGMGRHLDDLDMKHR